MAELSLAWSPFIRDLADFVRQRGSGARAYIVGGAARDVWLRGATADIDITVDGDAIGLARKVADWLDGDIYVMDRERGVARVFARIDGDALCLDFARFRGRTLEADLRDRDFTINAMAADLLDEPGALIDPLGGADDMRRRILRRCAPGSIAADPIRVLRAVRFSAQLELKIEPDTVADLRAHAPRMSQVSGERVRDEFFKLLALDKAARALRVLARLDALGMIVPGLESMPATELTLTLSVVERMSAILTAISSRRTDNTAAAFDLGMLTIQLDRFRPALQAHLSQTYGKGREGAQLLVLASLIHRLDAVGDISPARGASDRVAERLRLSVDERRKLGLALGAWKRVFATTEWTDLARHRFWHRLGAGGIDVILLAAAQAMGAAGSDLAQAAWLRQVEAITALLDAFFNRYDEIVSPRLFLNGNSICDLLGIRPGPAVGRHLTALREAQVTGVVSDVAAAREFVLRAGDSFAQPRVVREDVE